MGTIASSTPLRKSCVRPWKYCVFNYLFSLCMDKPIQMKHFKPCIEILCSQPTLTHYFSKHFIYLLILHFKELLHITNISETMLKFWEKHYVLIIFQNIFLLVLHFKELLHNTNIPETMLKFWEKHYNILLINWKYFPHITHNFHLFKIYIYPRSKFIQSLLLCAYVLQKFKYNWINISK